MFTFEERLTAALSHLQLVGLLPLAAGCNGGPMGHPGAEAALEPRSDVSNASGTVVGPFGAVGTRVNSHENVGESPASLKERLANPSEVFGGDRAKCWDTPSHLF